MRLPPAVAVMAAAVAVVQQQRAAEEGMREGSRRTMGVEGGLYLRI
jgi:hypothetical protein